MYLVKRSYSPMRMRLVGLPLMLYMSFLDIFQSFIINRTHQTWWGFFSQLCVWYEYLLLNAMRCALTSTIFHFSLEGLILFLRISLPLPSLHVNMNIIASETERLQASAFSEFWWLETTTKWVLSEIVLFLFCYHIELKSVHSRS